LELTQAKIKLKQEQTNLTKERKEVVSMYREMLAKKEISQDMFTQLLQDLMK
jgi:DNA-binding protein H-NS